MKKLGFKMKKKNILHQPRQVCVRQNINFLLIYTGQYKFTLVSMKVGTNL